MNIYIKTIPKLFKKAAALSAAVFLFANFALINKENLKFVMSGFGYEKAFSVQQNAFNISAHINKTANTISSLFKTKNSINITSADNSNKNAASQDSKFLKLYLPGGTVLNAAGSSLQSLSDFLCLNGFSVFKMYVDPGGGQPPGSFTLLISYFLIMLLFFASSRKVFNNVFAYKTVKYRLMI
ncbi:MAG: hypothetical protein FWG57_00475 [Endomicrobia bacterium]|nr:hypothetical protein [Endomicrobiia bacterium]